MFAIRENLESLVLGRVVAIFRNWLDVGLAGSSGWLCRNLGLLVRIRLLA